MSGGTREMVLQGSIVHTEACHILIHRLPKTVVTHLAQGHLITVGLHHVLTLHED